MPRSLMTETTSSLRPKHWAVAGATFAIIALLLLGASACTTLPTAETTSDTSATVGVSATADPSPPEPAPVAASEVPVGPSVATLAASVVRVVDGDTAVFRLADGSVEKVRFTGIDTPESTTQVEEYGMEAAAYTRETLAIGRQVFLERDAEQRDRYGRLLAYVWLSKPQAATEAEIRRKMFNAQLALDGYAQQMTIQPNSKYAEYFRKFVAEARTAEKGLWGTDVAVAAPAPAPAPRAAPTPAPTTTYIGNRNTMKFHYANCSSVGDMNPANKVPMRSREQAVSGGYVPCKRCNP